MMKIVRNGFKVWILMRFLKEQRRLKRRKLEERKGMNCWVLSRQDNNIMVLMFFLSLFLVVVMVVTSAYGWQAINVPAVSFWLCRLFV